MKLEITKLDIPNILTFFRLFSTPLFIWLLYLNDDTMTLCATIIFILAGLSDFLDGYLARYWNAHSIIGKVLDPIADKLVVLVAIIMLVYLRKISGFTIFPAIAILMREIIISGFRESLAELKFAIPVSKIGKWKTATQLISISILLFSSITFLTKYVLFSSYIEYIGLILFWISAGLSLYSGFEYINKSYKFLLDNKNL